MDPRANIERQRELATTLLTLNQCGSTDAPDDDTVDRMLVDAAELAELVLGLDEWRRRGGFDPALAAQGGEGLLETLRRDLDDTNRQLEDAEADLRNRIEEVAGSVDSLQRDVEDLQG